MSSHPQRQGFSNGSQRGRAPVPQQPANKAQQDARRLLFQDKAIKDLQLKLQAEEERNEQLSAELNDLTHKLEAEKDENKLMQDIIASLMRDSKEEQERRDLLTAEIEYLRKSIRESPATSAETSSSTAMIRLGLDSFTLATQQNEDHWNASVMVEVLKEHQANFQQQDARLLQLEGQTSTQATTDLMQALIDRVTSQEDAIKTVNELINAQHEELKAFKSVQADAKKIAAYEYKIDGAYTKGQLYDYYKSLKTAIWDDRKQEEFEGSDEQLRALHRRVIRRLVVFEMCSEVEREAERIAG